MDALLPVFICPGFHEPALTQQWIKSLPGFVQPTVLKASPVSPLEIYQALVTTYGDPSEALSESGVKPPIVAVGFSAGVVGLVGAIALWQQHGGTCARFIAIDGWAVPILGIPVTRISHDRFTHITTLPLGAGDTNFYATPGVEHLQLWGEPENVPGIATSGWQVAQGIPMTAAEFVRRSLQQEWNASFNWRTAVAGAGQK